MHKFSVRVWIGVEGLLASGTRANLAIDLPWQTIRRLSGTLAATRTGFKVWGSATSSELVLGERQNEDRERDA